MQKRNDGRKKETHKTTIDDHFLFFVVFWERVRFFSFLCCSPLCIRDRCTDGYTDGRMDEWMDGQ